MPVINRAILNIIANSFFMIPPSKYRKKQFRSFSFCQYISIIYFILYYFTFKIYIEKRNLKTPGREENFETGNEENFEEVSVNKNISTKLLKEIIEAVGGEENIKKVDACFTRLRLTLEDNSKVNDLKIFEKSLGASGAVLVENGIQIIYGNRANLLKIEMREFLKHE